MESKRALRSRPLAETKTAAAAASALASARLVDLGYDSQETETDVSSDSATTSDSDEGDSKGRAAAARSKRSCRRDKFEAVKDITPEVWRRVVGRVFFCSRLNEAVQVIDHTQCFVKVRMVPSTRTSFSLTDAPIDSDDDESTACAGAASAASAAGAREQVDWAWIKKHRHVNKVDKGSRATTGLVQATVMRRQSRRATPKSFTYCLVFRKGHRFIKVYGPRDVAKH